MVPIKWKTPNQSTWEQKQIGYWAPGEYMCTCMNCKQTYMGDKRSRQCYPCAIEQTNQIVVEDNLGVQLAVACLKLDAMNQMLDDFGTETLIKYTPELVKLESKIVDISKKIVAINERSKMPQQSSLGNKEPVDK